MFVYLSTWVRVWKVKGRKRSWWSLSWGEESEGVGTWRAGEGGGCGEGRLTEGYYQPNLFPSSLGAGPVPALCDNDIAFWRLCSRSTLRDRCPCRILVCHQRKTFSSLESTGVHMLCLWGSGHLVPFSYFSKISQRWVTILSTSLLWEAIDGSTQRWFL